jgi:aminopeptidase N
MAHAIQPVGYQKIDNFYTATVYEKGAEVIRMMHTLLGPERFRKGTDLYFQRHDGQAVTTEDFVAALEAGGGADLSQFRRWYRQVGTPRVTVEERWDAAAGELTLELAQQVPGWSGEPLGPLHIPLALGLLDQKGHALPVQVKGGPRAESTWVLELREERQTVVLEGLAARPHLSLLRGFSAPVKVERTVDSAGLAFLLAHDSDPFARWEAGQRLYASSLRNAAANLRDGRPAQVDPHMVEAWRATLLDADRDPAFIAQALSLPGYSVLEQEFHPVPVDALLQSQDLHRQTLARACREELLNLYDRYARELATRPHVRTPRDTGMRSLRNHCLSLLSESSDPAMARTALEQFKNATCMSDAMGAMTALAHTTTPEREEVLRLFAARWAGNPVVMNAWFAVQAISRREDTLERVQALLDHPQFDLRNPNKVRSLLVAFAANNPLRFHEAGGRAYGFFADRLLEVDTLNSHMGAAMVRQLMNWKRHEPRRADLLKTQLERVAGHAGLSPNAFEIASKSLEA